MILKFNTSSKTTLFYHYIKIYTFDFPATLRIPLNWRPFDFRRPFAFPTTVCLPSNRRPFTFLRIGVRSPSRRQFAFTTFSPFPAIQSLIWNLWPNISNPDATRGWLERTSTPPPSPSMLLLPHNLCLILKLHHR